MTLAVLRGLRLSVGSITSQAISDAGFTAGHCLHLKHLYDQKPIFNTIVLAVVGGGSGVLYQNKTVEHNGKCWYSGLLSPNGNTIFYFEF